METLTARTSKGTEFAVELKYGLNGAYGEIGGTYVRLDYGKKDGEKVPTIFLTKKTANKLLGKEVEGHICLDADWKPFVERIEKERIEIAMQHKIIGYEYRIGCDAASTYRFVYDGDEGDMYARRQADKELAEILLHQEISEIAERANAEKLEADGTSYGGYKFDKNNVSVMLITARKKLDSKIAKHVAETKKAEAEKAAKFAEAKETGEPVLLEKMCDSCNRKNEECDFDLIYVWAMPDGSTKTEREHTW